MMDGVTNPIQLEIDPRQSEEPGKGTRKTTI